MKAARTILSIFIITILHIHSNGQDRIDLPVIIDQKELVMPWNGGFNAPQFANIDLNDDGITDLITFDRQGDILRTYIHLPATGRWVLDWNYMLQFPSLVDWVQVADFNQDGFEDLFTSSSPTGVPGITVYKGSYANEQWSFTEKPDRGKSYLQVTSGGGLANLYVAWDDLPAISDVDGDGDLDILVFEPGGSYISYYANQSVEKGWGLDSLRFELKDICWGKIIENELSEAVYLSDNPDICSDGNFTGEEPVIPRHAGSTVMALDVDFDGDKDAFIGDISSRRLVFLHNGMDASHAWITEQDNHFPSNDTSVDLPYFVGSFSVQLDDDPEPELLAAINSRSLTEDKVSVWRYDDADPGAGPLQYTLTEKAFLQNEMIDLGSHSRPTVADINGDGLPDLLIGGYVYNEGSTTRLPSLWYFENKGTSSQPFFERASDDFLGMSQYATIPTFDFAPAFGDIDGNGSIDLVVGEQNGKIFFYKNAAAPGDAMSFEAAVYPYMNISVGVSATPQIVDINGDGLGDLIVGERTGNADNLGRCSNLTYFENVGTPGNSIFNADATVAPNTQCFGRLLFDIPPGLPQYSTPAVFRTQQGLMLMMGGDPGQLLLYDDVENGKTGAVTLVDDAYSAIDVGNRSAPALADLNNDGAYELIVGNQRGGLELFSTPLVVGYTSVAEPSAPAEKPYHLNGSLGIGIVDITWKSGVAGTVHIFDLFGKAVNCIKTENGLFSRYDLSDNIPGVYFLHISTGHNEWIEKIVKQ